MIPARVRALLDQRTASRHQRKTVRYVLRVVRIRRSHRSAEVISVESEDGHRTSPPLARLAVHHECGVSPCVPCPCQPFPRRPPRARRRAAQQRRPCAVSQRYLGVDSERNLARAGASAVGMGHHETPAGSQGLRRTTGGLFVFGALAFTAAATLLASTFDWPDILRQPADVVLPASSRAARAWSGRGSRQRGRTPSWPSRSCCSPPYSGVRTIRCSGPPPRSAPPPCCCR